MNAEADAEARLYALLHDAPEYVMGDIISPFKAAMGGNYKEVENRLLGAVYLHFALNAAAAGGAAASRSSGPTRKRPITRRCTWPGFAVEEARKFFGEPSLAAFDLERFERADPAVADARGA